MTVFSAEPARQGTIYVGGVADAVAFDGGNNVDVVVDWKSDVEPATAPQLSTPFADFVMLGENAIHGTDRAQIDALVEQAGVDFGGSQINKSRLPQQVEYDLALFRDKRPHRRWPSAHRRKRLSPEGLAAMKAGAR